MSVNLSNIEVSSRQPVVSQNYNKDEFLELYESLKQEYEDIGTCREAFVDFAYGLSLYNASSYRRLVMDMCLEFIFQKTETQNIWMYNNEYDDEYLLHAIKYFGINEIVSLVTNNRYYMLLLAHHYSIYDCFDKAKRDEVIINNGNLATSRIIRKLRKGKLIVVSN